VDELEEMELFGSESYESPLWCRMTASCPCWTLSWLFGICIMQVILASHDKDGLGCIISPSNYMASGERCDSCLQGTRCSKEIKNRPSVSL